MGTSSADFWTEGRVPTSPRFRRSCLVPIFNRVVRIKNEILFFRSLTCYNIISFSMILYINISFTIELKNYDY